MKDPYDQQEASQLEELGKRFMDALALREAGKVDEAEESLRDILKVEPRLAEPRMELGRILVDTDRVAEAEEHVRMALEQLEAGGQWTDELPEDVVLGLCHALLAEILRRRADEDDVIFGDPEAFHALVRESKQHFDEAARLDPSDEYSSYHAFFMGHPNAQLIGDE